MQSIGTKPTDWRRVFASNSTATSFTTRTDTLTRPSGDGVIDLQSLGADGVTPNTVAIQFYGTDTNDQTGLCRVYGVSAITESGVTTGYHYTPIFSGTLTLNSSLTGVANGPVTAGNYYADTLTRTVGDAGVGDSVISPGDNTGPATLLADTKGHALLVVDLHRNGSSASLNALARGV